MFPHYAALVASLASLEARLAPASELFRGCSQDAAKAAAAVFGVEFDALRAVSFPLDAAAPRLAAWLQANAWSAPWWTSATAAAAGAAACAASTKPAAAPKPTKGKAAKQTEAAAPAEAAAAAAAPAAAEPAAGGAAGKPAAATKPAKAAGGGGKAPKGGSDYAATLLSAVTTEPLAPPAGATFDASALRLPLLQVRGWGGRGGDGGGEGDARPPACPHSRAPPATAFWQALTDAFSAAIATAFPLAASKGVTAADVAIVTQARAGEGGMLLLLS